MTRQDYGIKLLKRVLNNLVELAIKFDNGNIKSVKLNGKTYSSIKFNPRFIENAMHEYATLEEKENGAIYGYSMLQKEPWKSFIDEAEKHFEEIRPKGAKVISEELELASLKNKFAALAAKNKNLENKIKMYEIAIKKHEINVALNDIPQIEFTENTDKNKTEMILAELLELLSSSYIVGIDKQKAGSPEIYFEYNGIDKKLCNLSDISDFIELDENLKIKQKNIIRIQG